MILGSKKWKCPNFNANQQLKEKKDNTALNVVHYSNK